MDDLRASASAPSMPAKHHHPQRPRREQGERADSALLAVAGLHHHLIREGTRTRVGLVLESGEPREVHHFSLLIGYGCGAINPYLAFETLDDMIRQGLLVGGRSQDRVQEFRQGATKGVVKVASKMGISTIQSYRGAQIFECVGLNQAVVDKYFTGTATRIEGADMDVIAEEVRGTATPSPTGRSTATRSKSAANTSGARKARRTFQPQTFTRCKRPCAPAASAFKRITRGW